MILTGAEDLKAQFKSIDFPVKRYCIIDNSCGNREIEKAIDHLYAYPSPYIDELVIIENAFNAGFSGSINQLIKQNPTFPYWCFFCVDWHPLPGQLKRLAERLEQPFHGLICDDTMHGYSAMVWTPELIQKVGLMDENFYPAYYEDNDHRYRMKLMGLDWQYCVLKSTHEASSTLHSSPRFIQRNRVTFPLNFEYYQKKWGGPPGKEQYNSPFNTYASVDYWPYDPTRITKQQWT